MQNKISENKILSVALISTLISFCLHIYLSIQHYKLKFGLGEGKSLCNINETFNCDAVTASQFSTLFGSPLSNWGAATHFILSVFLILVWLGLSADKKSLLRYSFWMGLLTAAMSIIMFLISMLKLGNYCLFCMATYVLSFIIFGCLWKLQNEGVFSHLISDITSLFTQSKGILFTFILIPGASLLSNSIVYDSYGFKHIELMTQESIANWKPAPQMNFDVSTGLRFQKGKGQPKLTIVEFADFLCPHCKSASPSLHAFAESHPDVQLIFKPFPLDGACNEAIQRQGDGLRCQLASLVYCSEKISQRGWEAHNYVFDRQQEWSLVQIDNDIKALSDNVHVPLEELKQCITQNETRDAISKMAKEGSDAKIMGTPTIFVNGKVLERGQFLPILQGVYDSAN